MSIQSIVLAAGQGTRMRSTLPKMLHPLLGKPLLAYGLEAARKATGSDPVVVVGHGSDRVRAAFPDQTHFVLQEPQLGTGHAVLQAEAPVRGNADLLLVTYGDMPLLTAESLKHIIELQQAHAGPIAMLTMVAQDPRGFGRIVRNADGYVQAIVEEAQATPEQRLIRELNPGVYCFEAEWLWQALHQVPLSPKGEYYLTDVIAIAVAQGRTVLAEVMDDPEEAIGVNTRVHLSEAAAILRRRINETHMLAGVTLIDPATTYIEPGVQIGQDTVIWPNTHLQGETTIGVDCVIGPNTIVRSSRIGNQCKVLNSVVEQALVEDRVQVGPFGHLRKGAHLAEGVHMGNFGEVKNSYLGPETKMGHFSYIGDATIGASVNIGCGTVTCNYDGVNKNKTELGDNVFIGSDTMLVAPITLGEGARTGAGAVVTKDVPPHTLVVGVPARPIRTLEKSD